MPTKIDQLFSGHAQAMALNRERLRLLASNIANADTPGFKARDLDFRAALDKAGTNAVRLAATRPGHMNSDKSDFRPLVTYRTPEQPSADGNTVDGDKEKAAFAEASVRYMASLTFLSNKIRSMRAAITGGR
ncbi:MAG: flagellar basal body rod protein FlgB [Gammaproteobacteria bacterium]|nr:flagellar basal body rod protein FlgB [Gammaproteobacteria bacterium]